MPEYTFTGLVPTAYPDSKDAAGAPVGEAEPGEIRDLTEAPDGMWREATDEDRAARAALMQRAEDEERFTGLVRQLADMGLNEASLGQITQAGAAEGLSAAEGLASGGAAAVQQLNREQSAAGDGGAAARRSRKAPETTGTDTAGTAPGSKEN